MTSYRLIVNQHLHAAAVRLRLNQHHDCRAASSQTPSFARLTTLLASTSASTTRLWIATKARGVIPDDLLPLTESKSLAPTSPSPTSMQLESALGLPSQQRLQSLRIASLSPQISEDQSVANKDAIDRSLVASLGVAALHHVLYARAQIPEPVALLQRQHASLMSRERNTTALQSARTRKRAKVDPSRACTREHVSSGLIAIPFAYVSAALDIATALLTSTHDCSRRFRRTAIDILRSARCTIAGSHWAIPDAPQSCIACVPQGCSHQQSQ